MGGIIRPLSGTYLLSIAKEFIIATSQSVGEGTCAVPRNAVLEFLEDYSLSTVDNLNSLNGNVKDHVICTMAELLLSVYNQLSSLQAEGPTETDNSQFLYVVLPVLLA